MTKEITKERMALLKEAEKLLNLNFKNYEIFDRALTHKSYSHEHREKEIGHNERLEFFGDAVLKLVVSEYIIHRYPKHTEGELTKVRASAVSDNHLYRLGKKLEIGRFLHMSENERRTGGEKRKSNLANSLEAVFGATYLDQGLKGSTELILSIMKKSIDEFMLEDKQQDHKSSLQELIQGMGWPLPEYKVTKESGPDHRKLFSIQVKVGKGLKRAKSEGAGHTKKEAEQKAAKNLLEEIKRKFPGKLPRLGKKKGVPRKKVPATK